MLRLANWSDHFEPGEYFEVYSSHVKRIHPTKGISMCELAAQLYLSPDVFERWTHAHKKNLQKVCQDYLAIDAVHSQ